TLTIAYLSLGGARGNRRATWAAFILGTSALAVAAGKMCLTDSVLLVFVTIGQICVYEMIRGNWGWPIILMYGIATGLAGLTKGPVVLGVQGMTVVASWVVSKFSPDTLALSPQDRGNQTRAVKVMVALIVIIAVVAPWIILVEHREPGFVMHS